MEILFRICINSVSKDLKSSGRRGGKRRRRRRRRRKKKTYSGQIPGPTLSDDGARIARRTLTTTPSLFR
jgi:hypothetical protein